jgi:hypothetical protein
MRTMAVRPSCTAINASQQDAKGVEAAIDMILSFFLSMNHASALEILQSD